MRTSRYPASVSVLSCLGLLAACGGDGGGSTIDARVFGEQGVPGGSPGDRLPSGDDGNTGKDA